jgi:integrase
MAGKQAKILSAHEVEDLLFFANTTRYAVRNRAIVLLSCKAGLRAAEIANPTWPMIAGPTGEVSSRIELQYIAAKLGIGRIIPINVDLRATLVVLRASS